MSMSGILRLNLADLGKGALTAVFTAVVLALGTAAQSGNFNLFSYDWASLLKLALGAGVGYLVKNLLTDTQGNFLGIGSPKPQA